MSNTFKKGDKVVAAPGMARSTVSREYDVVEGRVYTVKSISDTTGNLRFEEKDTIRAGGAVPPAHRRGRFVLAPAAGSPSRAFEPGDKLRCIRGTGHTLIVGHAYSVESADGEFVHLEGAVGGWDVARFVLEQPAPPRDYRLMCKGVLPRSFETPEAAAEAAAEAARKMFNDGEDFSIVELTTVSKHTVRKVVEARV
ncbi:hypothetical protein ACJBUE_20805 (plasmid) [Ralstonia syzygii subsp. celebesensis]|uniref:Uncharacterized protein n=1 Tax=blood disease bacterium R229 TaxID=741978 RepID=G2ZVX8_9RALS|nr:hypothetical protein [Ralstonia syzygii]QQV57839.1 hypothetical protein JK151_20650 [Ralstonia syzygii subsp. celebesensis]CCA83259.1 hypothetical protein BDB_mp60425 [blood disease bacterium R229]